MEIVTKLGFVLLGLVIILNWGLIMAGIIRKIIARASMRRGISITQPYINLF